MADALHRLRDTFNEDAEAAIWQEHVGHEHVAVDGTLTADGRELECQVTRVEGARTLRTRALEGTATSHNDFDALAANVIEAFESKLNSADPNMILVLDANDAPAFADERVVEMARAAIRNGGYSNRWAEVWLVGPTTKLTTRLDDA